MNYKKIYNEIITELVELSMKYYKDRLCFILLFGSVAKDLHTNESDIDLLIVLEEKISNDDSYTEFYENIVDNLKFAKEFKTMPQISPKLKSINELSVKSPYLWGEGIKILYQKNNLADRFIEDLKQYQSDELLLRENKIVYYEFKNG